MTSLQAFTADHVCRLTGLSMRQLRCWDSKGFFSPRYADENRRAAFSRVYSFRDLVGLRVLAVLRNQHHVPLQELRKGGAWLAERYETPWASLRFYVGGRRVFFDDPRSGNRLAGRPLAQTAMPIEMQEIATEMQAAVSRLGERQAEQIGQITRHRHVAQNAPVLAGTRIPTSAIWSFHEAGYDVEAIVREYPRLTADDVQAAIAYEEQGRRKRVG